MSKRYPKTPFLILPLTRLELPGWGYLYSKFGAADVEGPRGWRDAPEVTARGKLHGYRMRLRLSNWSERKTYFLGRFYDLPLQLAMIAYLKPRDRFVDVGANIGMISLHASYLVGDLGRVDSIEPNPECCDRIREHVTLNQIANIHLHQVGLADTDGEATLSLESEHTGTGTLSNPAEGSFTKRRFTVETARGDDILSVNPTPVRMIKIDVEGYELLALRGLERTVASSKPVIVTELLPNQLTLAGTSRREIYDLLSGWGYSPLGMSYRSIGKIGWKKVLDLKRIRDGIESARFRDYLWLHEQTPAASTLLSFSS